MLFACAVPLLRWLWQVSWRLNNRWARLPALVLFASLLAWAWYCLIMTFSRGGLVAAAAALLYQIGAAAWQGRKSVNPPLIIGGGVAEKRRMVEFHTDSTQNMGVNPHHPAEPRKNSNAKNAMKSSIDEASAAGFTARPSHYQ